MPKNMKEYYTDEIMRGLLRDARRHGYVGIDDADEVERKLMRESLKTLERMANETQGSERI